MNESHQIARPAPYDDEIDLRDVILFLWSGKWTILAASVVSAIVAIIVAILLPNMYRAETLLAPNEQDGAGGLSALAAQYGGLATLAGINIGAGSTNKAELALKIMKSRKFISEFVESRHILVPLIAAKGWDVESGDLLIDPSIYDVEVGKWVRREKNTRSSIPSMLEAHEEFLDILSVIEDKNSGFVTVSIEHYSPQIAKQWVDWLIEDLNYAVMHQDVTEAKEAIDFLNEEIEKTSLTELQKVFFNLIEEQTKVVMLAKVSPEYVFRTIDPATVPEERSNPNRILIVVLGLLLGALLGVPLLMARKGLRSRAA